MIILNVVVLFGLFSGIILCTVTNSDFLGTVNKKEHRLYPLYPLANCLIRKTPLGRLLTKKNNKAVTMKALYFTEKPEQLNRLYWCNKLSLIVVILITLNFISLFSYIAESNNSIILDGGYIRRPEQGEGSRQVDLTVYMERVKSSAKSDKDEKSQSQDVRVNIEERDYTKQELSLLMNKAFEYLETAVLADNKSLDYIVTNLNFINRIPQTSLTVDWVPDDTDLIEANGTVHNQMIESQGVITRVTVIVSCQNQRAERILSFHVMPGRRNEQSIRDALIQELLQTEQASSADSQLKLPAKFKNYRLIWSDRKKDNTGTLILIGVLSAIALWIGKDRELESKLKKRKQQMLIDYPELVNKFTLLINAGMTIKQAWIKIASDYSSGSGKFKERKRYAYEEMLVTANELRLGIPEHEAYEQYGRRIGLIPYIKLSSLITQNLKKGTRGFTQQLTMEAKEAFEERKEIARRLGEEAGTKLLIPMMVLMIMVFLIIMIPAFMAFRM